MKAKLACADFTFPLLEHDKVLALAKILEFDAIDIGLFEGRSHLQPSKTFVDSEKNAYELSDKLRDNNLVPADVFLQVSADFVTMASNHPNLKTRGKARTIFLESLDFISICNGNHTSGLPGVYFNEESCDTSYGRACEEMAWRLEKAKEHDIVFSIEPHIGSIVQDPKSVEQLVKDVPGLSLTLDYTHFTKLGVQDSQIEPLIKYASHFHARGAAKGYLQTSFKNNTIDYKRVAGVMKETGYSGYIGIEYIWIDWENCNEVDNISEVILLRDFLNSQFSDL